MRRIVLLLLVCSIASAQTIEIAPATESGRAIQSLIEKASMDELRWPDFSDYRKHLRNFYGANGYALAWSQDGKATPQALTVIDLLQAADAKGINAVDYDAPRWPSRLKSLNESNAARFDLALTVALMRYISDLHIGRVNPRNVRWILRTFDIRAESQAIWKSSPHRTHCWITNVRRSKFVSGEWLPAYC